MRFATCSALEVDATKFLPPDDSTHGFDNIAGALTLSPALMEAYLSAAGKISRLAIGDVSAPTQAVFEVPADTAQNYHIEGLPFGTRGGILIKYQFPADGEYTFKVKGVTGYFQAVLGGVKGEQLEVTVDGERVKLFDWDKEIANTTGNGKSTPRIPVKAGLHTVGVTFLATNDVPGSELNRPFQRTMNTPGSIPGFLFYPHVGQVWIEGPYNAAGRQRHGRAGRRFSCATRPPPATKTPCARTIISTLVKHAFRRPATPADLATLTEFYQAGRSDGGSFDDGIEAALQRVLADPEFVYRDEAEPAGSARRQELPHQRSGAGFAAVLLPVEQRSRRRVDRPRRAGQAQGSGRARETGAAHAGGSEVRCADHQLHRAVAGRALAARPASRS